MEERFMNTTLLHKSCGRILAVHSVEHITEDGIAYWQFRGDVQWNDGGLSKNVPIAPYQLISDPESAQSKEECDCLLQQMNDYLHDEGRWHDMKHKRDGRCYSWTPKKPTGERTIVELTEAAKAGARQ
jgi:hypothetical protein